MSCYYTEHNKYDQQQEQCFIARSTDNTDNLAHIRLSYKSTLYADQEALRIVKLVNDRCTQGFKNDKTSKQAKRFAEHDHS